MDIEVIKRAIKNWSILVQDFEKVSISEENYEITGNTILKYLNQGNYFKITEKEIENWKNTIKHIDEASIHVYVAIDSNTGFLKFYLIDSENDGKGDFDNTIIEKDFLFNIGDNIGSNAKNLIKNFDNSFPVFNSSDNPPNSNSISLESIFTRCFKWTMLCEDWLKNQKKADLPIFKVMEIPFKDYTALKLAPGEVCFNFFGLRESTLYNNNELEIIVTKAFTLETIITSGQDFSTPRPPFTLEEKEGYKLLIESENV